MQPFETLTRDFAIVFFLANSAIFRTANTATTAHNILTGEPFASRFP